ncbi:UNVERIFIED_CONTAM: hypothetical protein NCL1_47617 [Trichonephila clavipes]
MYVKDDESIGAKKEYNAYGHFNAFPPQEPIARMSKAPLYETVVSRFENEKAFKLHISISNNDS